MRYANLPQTVFQLVNSEGRIEYRAMFPSCKLELERASLESLETFVIFSNSFCSFFISFL